MGRCRSGERRREKAADLVDVHHGGLALVWAGEKHRGVGGAELDGEAGRLKSAAMEQSTLFHVPNAYSALVISRNDTSAIRRPGDGRNRSGGFFIVCENFDHTASVKIPKDNTTLVTACGEQCSPAIEAQTSSLTIICEKLFFNALWNVAFVWVKQLSVHALPQLSTCPAR